MSNRSEGRPPKSLPYNTWDSPASNNRTQAVLNPTTERAIAELKTIYTMEQFVKVETEQKEKEEKVERVEVMLRGGQTWDS